MKLRGECKKEVVREYPLFSDVINFKREFKINVGENVSIEYDNQSDMYLLYLHFHKIRMNQRQIEEHFTITWKQGCYNTCIRDGRPCNRIGHRIPEGTSSLDRYSSNCCRIGWEIGRAACGAYE